MAKKGITASTYMTAWERVLGGVLLALYLVVLPFAAEPVFAFLGQLAGRSISQAVQSAVCSYTLLVLVLVVFWNYIGRTTGYFLSGTLPALSAAGMGLVALYGLNELACRMFRLVAAGQPNLNDAAVAAPVGTLFAGSAFIAAFAAPVVEEALFRGYVFGNLRDRSRTAAYIVSCLLYALPRVWQFAMVDRTLAAFLGMVQYLVPAAVLAWTYERSGTLWSSILLHCFINIMAVM